MNNLHIYPLPALRDNYIWIIHDTVHAALVDPGDAKPALAFLHAQGLQPVALLITHHHGDHTGGNRQLLEQFDVPVYGPEPENISSVTHPVKEGDTIHLPQLALTLDVIDIPGHTHGHIAYYAETQQENMLFCGDTLFSCGCGRIFEGTPQQMFESLQKLARLPEQTQIYCTHEYTLGNMHFARIVEPDNDDLRQLEIRAKQLRQNNLPTLPTNIATEKACNPFLRCQQPEIINCVNRHSGKTLSEPVEVFTELREWKNAF